MLETISFREIRESQAYQKSLASYTVCFQPKDDYEAMLIEKITFAVTAQRYADNTLEYDYWDRMHFRSANHLMRLRRGSPAYTRSSSHVQERRQQALQAQSQEPQAQVEALPQEDLSLLSKEDLIDRIKQATSASEEMDVSNLSRDDLMAEIYDIVNPIDENSKKGHHNPYRTAHSVRPVNNPLPPNLMGPSASGPPTVPQQGDDPQHLPPTEPPQNNPSNETSKTQPPPGPDGQHPNQDKPPP